MNRQSGLPVVISLFAVLVLALPLTAYGQASLFSFEAPMIRALLLEGSLEQPFLVYRSLADETWDEAVLGSDIWIHYPRLSSHRLGDLELDILPVEFYTSYNSSLPHGMNDGALWQGVGTNARGSLGFRLKVPLLSLTFKPELYFSQNLPFDIMPTVYPDSGGFGYFRYGMDAYQRPGDESLAGWSWGDSELRLDWQSLTVGFGTQASWLGPGKSNAIILSNNATPFPKLDFGLRKTETLLGSFEARAFWGRLEESDWFNTDPEDDYTFLTGLAMGWSPFFFPELTLGFNRVMLSNWADNDWLGMADLLIPVMDSRLAKDQRDQRASVTGELLFTEVGFRIWFEWARNDHNRKFDSVIRYPFHSQAYTLGFEKQWRLDKNGWMLMLEAELGNTESSRNYSLISPGYNFYGHHLVRHGHTNQGQIIGAGIGSGGTFQRLALVFLPPIGEVTIYVQRRNRDNDYVYDNSFDVDPTSDQRFLFNAELSFGVDSTWMLGRGFIGNLGLGYNLNHNPLYNPEYRDTSTVVPSFHGILGLKWQYGNQ